MENNQQHISEEDKFFENLVSQYYYLAKLKDQFHALKENFSQKADSEVVATAKELITINKLIEYTNWYIDVKKDNIKNQLFPQADDSNSTDYEKFKHFDASAQSEAREIMARERLKHENPNLSDEQVEDQIRRDKQSADDRKIMDELQQKSPKCADLFSTLVQERLLLELLHADFVELKSLPQTEDGERRKTRSESLQSDIRAFECRVQLDESKMHKDFYSQDYAAFTRIRAVSRFQAHELFMAQRKQEHQNEG